MEIIDVISCKITYNRLNLTNDVLRNAKFNNFIFRYIELYFVYENRQRINWKKMSNCRQNSLFFPQFGCCQKHVKKWQPVLSSGSFSCMFLRWCIFHFKGHSKTRAFKNAFCVLYYPPYTLPKLNKLFWNACLYSLFLQKLQNTRIQFL